MATASADFESWQKHRLLGKGSFGEVWLVTTDSGRQLAAKYIKMAVLGAHDLSEINKEIRILSKLSHPNVVQFVTVREVGGDMVVFTEVIDGRDLAACGRLSESDARGYLQQICAGLKYLHTRRPAVLHRDIKGQNIMVARNGTVKLIDFGLSVNIMVASGMTATQVFMTTYNGCGTLPFMAPELFAKKCKFSVKSDVWALGMTIYQMVAGRPPFADAGGVQELVNWITTSGAPPLPDSCSQQLADFYARCTALDPSARKSVRKLLKHALFA